MVGGPYWGTLRASPPPPILICLLSTEILFVMTCKGTLRQVFYICLRPLPSNDTIPLPPYTLYKCIQFTYSLREGREGSGRKLTREKVSGAMVHKAGRKYQHNCLYLQSINSIDNRKDDI
jgi:hypothetical protein